MDSRTGLRPRPSNSVSSKGKHLGLYPAPHQEAPALLDLLLRAQAPTLPSLGPRNRTNTFSMASSSTILKEPSSVSW